MWKSIFFKGIVLFIRLKEHINCVLYKCIFTSGQAWFQSVWASPSSIVPCFKVFFPPQPLTLFSERRCLPIRPFQVYQTREKSKFISHHRVHVCKKTLAADLFDHNTRSQPCSWSAVVLQSVASISAPTHGGNVWVILKIFKVTWIWSVWVGIKLKMCRTADLQEQHLTLSYWLDGFFWHCIPFIVFSCITVKTQKQFRVNMKVKLTVFFYTHIHIHIILFDFLFLHLNL